MHIRDIIDRLDSLSESSDYVDKALAEAPASLKDKIDPSQFNGILQLDLAAAQEKAREILDQSGLSNPRKRQQLLSNIEAARNPADVVKLLYNFYLAGDGNAVIGSRYGARFNEADDTDLDDDADDMNNWEKSKLGMAPDEIERSMRSDSDAVDSEIDVDLPAIEVDPEAESVEKEKFDLMFDIEDYQDRGISASSKTFSVEHLRDMPIEALRQIHAMVVGSDDESEETEDMGQDADEIEIDRLKKLAGR